MDTTVTAKNRRIIIIDDNEDIHNDFRRILRPRADTTDLDQMEASFFRTERVVTKSLAFELTSVYQGQEALKEVRRALQDGAPYALAFVDMRMPPGWDGIETLQRLWEEDQSLQAVICSAYSDYSWDDVVTRLGQTDRLLILKKPFEPIEVRQMACALAEKWSEYHSTAEATRRMAVQYRVTQILMESAALADAGTKLLRSIGEAFGWPFGVLWRSEEGGQGLVPLGVWSTPSAELVPLVAATRRGVFVMGEEVSRRALAAHEASFTAFTNEGGGGGSAAARAGLRSVLCFPIKAGDLTFGVIEFFASSGRAPDQGLFDTMGEICAKIGQFIESKRIESALQRSEADNRGLLHALPDTILRVGRNGTCLDFKASRDLSPSLQPRFCVERTLEEALPVEVAEELMQNVERALADNMTHVFEYRQPVGDEVRDFEARVAGIEPSEAVVIIRDITEPKRAKADAEQRRVREETIRAQAETLLALSTPLIPITDTTVVMPLIGAMDAPRMQQVQTALIQGISAHRTRVVILDMTGVTNLDPEVSNEILHATQAARLLGREIVLTGIQPEIAQVLVSQGENLRGVAIHRTLQSGVAFALRGALRPGPHDVARGTSAPVRGVRLDKGGSHER